MAQDSGAHRDAAAHEAVLAGIFRDQAQHDVLRAHLHAMMNVYQERPVQPTAPRGGVEERLAGWRWRRSAGGTRCHL
jgi:hypothetical protein